MFPILNVLFALEGTSLYFDIASAVLGGVASVVQFITRCEQILLHRICYVISFVLPLLSKHLSFQNLVFVKSCTQ